VPDTGEKDENAMKKKTHYKTAPKKIAEAIETSERIDDFLPPPEELVEKEENVRVTISLSRRSVEFFKNNAEKLGIPYQVMIRTVLDKYSSHYQ
jgi:predicted DNA binding CopG/RHH family protein